MRSSIFWNLLAVTSLAAANVLPPRNYATHDYYAIHLSPSTSPLEIATHLGVAYEGKIGAIPDHYLFKAPKQDVDLVEDAVQELKRRRRKRDVAVEPHPLDAIRYNKKQKLKPRMWKRSVLDPLVTKAGPPIGDAVSIQREIANQLQIEDPIFNDQWHLFNTQILGNDLNITDVWLQGITGKNATVCIVDDGLDMESEDLKNNYFAQGSYDFNDHVDQPKPRLADDRHGTRCAGEVAAGRNNVCGVGVAYDSRISAVRILSGEISDVDEAAAINYELQLNDIYSCSWGPPDDGRTMQAPDALIEKAMITAVQTGRGGKGSIYVFAAGNGAASDDNCNFDGYTNSIYSVTVGAIDRNNLHPYYSEQCSAQLVVTYSSGSSDAIHTTDVGVNKCTVQHGGTSAAGPLAAGIYALVLETRPEVTWRDIQWLTVMTAVPFDQPSDWAKTTIGRTYSHQFGYGKLDAWAIVEAAKTWKLVKPQAWLYSPWMHIKKDIPQGDTGLASTFEVTKEALEKANLERLEHVTLTMNVQHTRRGDISVELISPSGITSHLSTARRDDDFRGGYNDWTFMSVAHFGETGIGNWTVIVKDTKVNEHTGSLTDWKLRLWGECIDPSIQTLRPLPSEHDDDDHDVITTAPAHTTAISIPSTTGIVSSNPTDHIDRPVNQKPTDTPSSTAAFEPPVTVVPEPTPSATGTPESFLPSPFPTFGVSKRTQVWIYGALGLILLFCASLATYLYLARRKRLRNSPRDDYEFEMLDDQDDDEARQSVNGAASGRRGKRRAGELYDAFAGESDEELFSEDDAEYRDEIPEHEEFDEKLALRGDGSVSDLDSGSGSGSGASRPRR
ncbi:KEX1 protease precursor [Lepidopterella palustris CBS 459.81]|uniref:KEX1 protease n=1 Tax=Lepidopterella palustris CBS 459.81 TaxID=1314670 RepID=A0A8E2JCM5_9PEZI|nr:KEX1 protease precursor [Lepidopterella palustris CBS 459.81]